MNENDLLVMAIKRLRPTAEFSIVGGDYASIKWDVLDGKAPTVSEITAAKNQIQKELEDAEAVKIAAESSAIAKLEAIGLTTAEIAALRG